MRQEKWFAAARITAAAVIAILLAEVIGLRFSVSAGIVAILSVGATKRETIRTAADRLIAFICALAIAFVCFACLGVTLPAFLVYLLFFIPLCIRFNWNSAMAMDSVLVSHFLTLGGMTADTVLNELGIFTLGAGSGILINLLLRSDPIKATRLTARMDEMIRSTLLRMAQWIRQQDLPDYDGSCINELKSAANDALALARSNTQNRLITLDDAEFRYITMRMRQIDTLEEMYQQIRDLRTTPDTGLLIADFLTRVASEYARENTVRDLLRAYERLERTMKDQPMPSTRDEFEARAALYAFKRLTERFLRIKADYMQS